MITKNWLTLSFLMVACRSQAPLPLPLVGGGTDQLPSLRLHHTSSRLDHSPTGLGTQFVVSRGGTIVLSDPANPNMLYSIIDSSGEVVGRAGRAGDGPGEVRGGKLVITDSGFVVASERLVQFGFDGDPVTTVTLSYPSYPRAFVPPDGLLDLTEGPPNGNKLGLTSLTGGKFRRLVPEADTFLANNFGLPTLPDGGTRNPALGLWSGGFLVGDGWTYRLALYDWRGTLVRMLHRDIEPPELSPDRLDRQVALTVRSLRAAGRRMDDAAIARVRSSAASQQQRHFSFHRPTGLDERGRIWVLGVEADSGFADVFNHDRFLGRLALPCAGFSHGWSLAGRWLVVACLPDDPDSVLDAVFKVFTVEG